MENRLNIILSIVILSVMVSCATMPSTVDVVKPNEPTNEDDHFSLAMTQYILNNNKIAINELNKIKEISSGNEAVINYIKGICYLRIEEYKKSIECFLDSEFYLPIKQELYNNIGVAYYRQGDKKKALEYFHKSYLEDPNFKVAIENYNLIINNNGLNDIDEIILLPFEGKATIYLSYGWFYYYLGNYPDAIYSFNNVIKYAPDYVMGYLSLGITYDTINNYDISIENYKLALEIDPYYPDIWNNLGISYYKIDDISKSKQCFNKAIELNPYYANPYNNLGFIMIGSDNNKTRELFLKSIELSGDLLLKSESYAGLSLIEHIEGNEDIAYLNKKNAIKLNAKLLNPDYLRMQLGWQEQWIESFLSIYNDV